MQQITTIPKIRELTAEEIETVSGGLLGSSGGSLSVLICRIEQTISCIFSQIFSCGKSSTLG